jgi:hypothetical protein
MTERKALFDRPSDVSAVDGKVEVEGPDDVDVALTPEAAEETSDRLLSQAFKARGQKRLKSGPHQPNRQR